MENYVTLPGSFAGFESFFRSLKERGVVVQEDKRRITERKQHEHEISVRTETISTV
jgi:hypothetical protein